MLGLVVVLVLAGVSIAIASRGDRRSRQEADGRQPERDPVPAGTDAASSTPAVSRNCKPAKDAFDTAELLDLPLEEARQKAAEKGCEIAVSVQDGAGQPVPIELNPKLIYVYTEKGRVTQIEGVGGGI